MREASRLLRASGLPFAGLACAPTTTKTVGGQRSRCVSASSRRFSGATAAAEIFGRDRLAEVLRDFFDRGAGPVQVIGALYTYEAYHGDLAVTSRAGGVRRRVVGS